MNDRSSRRTPPARPTGLRERIVDAADALLREGGVAALSMREVARRAGVTHQAPYHHFADRESILADLVIEGFERLAQRLARVNDASHGVPAHRWLRDSCRAYVHFALDEPGRFSVMFRPELCDRARFPAVLQAGEQAYGELLRMVAGVHGSPDDVLASLHWSQVHGLASLLVDGSMLHKLPTARARRAYGDTVIDRFAAMTAPAGGGGSATDVATGPEGARSRR